MCLYLPKSTFKNTLLHLQCKILKTVYFHFSLILNTIIFVHFTSTYIINPTSITIIFALDNYLLKESFLVGRGIEV
jgi:hypothetical protein